MGTGTCDCRHGASFRDCPFAFLVAYHVKASSDQSPIFPSFFQPRTPEESRLRSAFVEKKESYSIILYEIMIYYSIICYRMEAGSAIGGLAEPVGPIGPVEPVRVSPWSP